MNDEWRAKTRRSLQALARSPGDFIDQMVLSQELHVEEHRANREALGDLCLSLRDRNCELRQVRRERDNLMTAYVRLLGGYQSLASATWQDSQRLRLLEEEHRRCPAR